MDLRLTDRVTIVSGSSRGIGRAIARAFLAEGGRVVITGRQADALAQAQAAFGAEFGVERLLTWCGDLSKPDQVSAVVSEARQRWGQIDCVVANVGSGRATSGWQLGRSEWDAAFEVNFWASVRLIEAVLPTMVEVGHGSIICVGSIAGVESVNAPLPYSAAKTALLSYSKNLARQVGRYGVRVNCVAPGNILFPGSTWEEKLTKDHGRVRQYIETEVALRRFGTPEEIADAVVFLCSERAAFISGSCLVVDGGQTRSF